MTHHALCSLRLFDSSHIRTRWTGLIPLDCRHIWLYVYPLTSIVAKYMPFSKIGYCGIIFQRCGSDTVYQRKSHLPWYTATVSTSLNNMKERENRNWGTLLEIQLSHGDLVALTWEELTFSRYKTLRRNLSKFEWMCRSTSYHSCCSAWFGGT